MFFARQNEYEPCGLFTRNHLILIIATIIGIIIALKNTIYKNQDEIKKIIKNMTIIIWILETIKILFNIYIKNLHNVNEYLPLYYCSILLYAGIMSSLGKGKIERMGNVFLATGGIIGGTVFILFPTTSLSTYPMLHFLSLYSFLFHGTMVYLGLLINITHYITIKFTDIYYYATLVGGVCLIALAVNNKFNSNLMFISKDFPGTPISILYKIVGKLFTPIMIIAQITIPFFIIYLAKILGKEEIKNEQS